MLTKIILKLNTYKLKFLATYFFNKTNIYLKINLFKIKVI